MKFLSILSICTAILFVSSHNIYAQYDYGFDFSKAGTAGLQSLKIGVGAREAAMGEAVSGVVNNVNSIFWNPAGLAYVESYEVSFTQNQWLIDSKHSAVAIAIPFEYFVVGLSAVNFSINQFEETTVLQPDGTGRMVDAGDLVLGLTVAKQFTDKLSIGGQIKYVREKLDDYSIDNVLFDVGALYYTGFHKLRLAFALQHFGPDMELVNQSFRTPLLFRVSATDDLIQEENYKLITAVELIHPTDNVEWVNVGAELMLYKTLALRGGYRINVDEGKVSFGVGLISPEINNIILKFDYSYSVSEIVFDDIHRFTIGLAFK